MKGCCYGYVRVSTTMQVQDGVSLDEQEMRIRAWATMNNMKLMGVYVDKGISGTFMFERPAFSKLMSFLERGDALVANDLGRVSRKGADIIVLIDKLETIGARAVFIMDGFDTSTSGGKMILSILSLVKGMEVNYTSERVRDTMDMMKQNGRNITKPPYGWKKSSPEKGSGLVEVPEQQVIIARIKQMHHEGNMSCYAIAKQLTKEGVPTPSGKGKKWLDEVVYNVIHRGEVAVKGRYDK